MLDSRSIVRSLLGFATYVTLACEDGGTATPDAAPPDAEPEPVPTVIELAFDRAAGGIELDVTAVVRDADGQAIDGIDVAMTADRGTLGPVTANGAHLVPDGTGRHTIIATAAGLTASRTALVVTTVHETWNQPEPVRGLADTTGYEDSIQISPDGRWLFLLYSPVPFDCLIGGDPASPTCRIVGPVDAPERPRMPGRARVHDDGTYDNGCPTLGISMLPFPIPPLAQYGFARQPDGSYAEPFVLGFGDSDGCATIYGAQVVDQSGDDANLVYAFDDPTDAESSELFAAPVTLGQDVLMGTFTVPGGVITLSGHIGTQLAAGNGTQGNPFAWRHDGVVDLIYDDEPGRQDLLFSRAATLFDTTWSPAATIPAPVSAAGVQESQPFIDGTTIYFRRDLTIWASDWNGGALDQAASWSAPHVVMDGNLAAGAEEVLGVGEPSVATVGGRRELYFVFVVRNAEGLLDLGVGMVPARVN